MRWSQLSPSWAMHPPRYQACKDKKVLEEYNKDLFSFAKKREATFIKAAPLLFGPQFSKDAMRTDHLEQVAALKRDSFTVRIFIRLNCLSGHDIDPTLQGKDPSLAQGRRLPMPGRHLK